MTRDPPTRGRRAKRGAARLIACNALLLAAAAALTAIAGEAYFRLTKPFMTSELPPKRFVPAVGFLWEPGVRTRFTNRLDFWVVSRTNSLGFFDREPPSPERAAAGCRVAVIGDSFVEALEVPIAQKFHVRLEALAAAAQPRLNVAASAFGLRATGQIQQLPFWDEYARRLRPRLLVLVFVPNDFSDNSPILRALLAGRDPQRPPPEARAARLANGEMEWRPPHPPANIESPPPRPPERAQPRALRAVRQALKTSWFAAWLAAKTRRPERSPDLIAHADSFRRNPRYAALLAGWRPPVHPADFGESSLPPIYEDALDYTAFALEQFKRRADRSGAATVILASHRAKISGSRVFERISGLAAALDIPVIDQADYIFHRGAALEDAQWPHDSHWNADGHQWAAEALLEWLQANPQICADAQGASPSDGPSDGPSDE